MRALASFNSLAFAHSSLAVDYVAQKPENEATYIEHAQSCRGVWGHAPPEKFRSCESASEAVGDPTIFVALECKLRRFVVLSFLGAPSLRNQPLCLRHYHRTVSSTWELQI